MKQKVNSFTKGERLCGVKSIDHLFREGHSFNLHPLRVFWLVTPLTPGQSPVRLVISVPKRHFKKATDRNLIKRQLREAWRKNRQSLLARLKEEQLQADIALIWSDKAIRAYDYIEQRLKEVLSKLAEL